MNGLLEAGLVLTTITMLLAVNFFLWATISVVLLGLLGWHPPGWLASPVAHAANTGFAIAGGAISIAAPILVDLALRSM